MTILNVYRNHHAIAFVEFILDNKTHILSYENFIKRYGKDVLAKFV